MSVSFRRFVAFFFCRLHPLFAPVGLSNLSGQLAYRTDLVNARRALGFLVAAASVP